MTAEASASRQGSPQKGLPQTVVKASTQPPAALLVPFCFWLPRSAAGIPSGGPADPDVRLGQTPDPAALSLAIGSHLAGLGWSGAEPLRWAITAVDPVQGLRLEGIGLHRNAATADAEA